MQDNFGYSLAKQLIKKAEAHWWKHPLQWKKNLINSCGYDFDYNPAKAWGDFADQAVNVATLALPLGNVARGAGMLTKGVNSYLSKTWLPYLGQTVDPEGFGQYSKYLFEPSAWINKATGYKPPVSSYDYANEYVPDFSNPNSPAVKNLDYNGVNEYVSAINKNPNATPKMPSTIPIYQQKPK